MTLEEFKTEVLPVKNKLFRFAKLLMKNRAEAEDIVQDVLLRLWSNREKMDEYKNIEAFSITITKNLCLDKLKSKASKTTQLKENLIVKDKNPDEEYESKDINNKINEIINRLPVQQKMIIQLRDIEGYGFEEISEVVNMTLNAIRVNLSRARKKVRDEIIKLQHHEFSRN